MQMRDNGNALDEARAALMRGVGMAVVAAAAFLVASGIAQAQNGTSGVERTTRSGVYTAEQASRGGDVYAMQCRSCHTPASHTGTVFASWWDRKTLSELFQFVATRMPKNEPGSLAPEEYAQVVAYLLKMNDMPPGDAELPADSLALRKIRIEAGAKDPRN